MLRSMHLRGGADTCWKMQYQDRMVKLEDRVQVIEQHSRAKDTDLIACRAKIAQLEQDVAVLRSLLESQNSVNHKFKIALAGSNAALETQGNLLNQYKSLLDALLKMMDDAVRDIVQIRELVGLPAYIVRRTR